MRRGLRRSFLICGLLCCSAFTLAVARDYNVSLECSSGFYAPAETVFATWTNDTDSTAVAGNHPPYEIYRAQDGELVCQGGLPWEYALAAHSSALLDWDQRDCTGEPVAPGPYIMRIYYAFNDVPPVFVVEDAFRILAPASAPDDSPAVRHVTWGKVRMAFR